MKKVSTNNNNTFKKIDDYNPTGKLSFSWPKSMDQLPISKADNYLFDFGYGLSY